MLQNFGFWYDVGTLLRFQTDLDRLCKIFDGFVTNLKGFRKDWENEFRKDLGFGILTGFGIWGCGMIVEGFEGFRIGNCWKGLERL